MTRNEVLNFGRVVRNENKQQTYFRSTIGKVKNLNLSMALLTNDKRLREVHETLTEVLSEKETKALKQAREEYSKAVQDKQPTQLFFQKLDNLYSEWISSKEIKEWLRGECIELKLETVELTEQELGKFDSDQLECLLFFVTQKKTVGSKKPVKK